MSKPVNPIERFFIRYNFVAMIIVASMTIGASIYLSYNTYLTTAEPDDTQQSNIPNTFDAKTVENVNSLHSSDDIPSVSVPAGRSNPFAE